MKAILEIPSVPREIDPEAVSDYFSFLYIPAPKSIFKNIRKVRPGHYLVASRDGISLEARPRLKPSLVLLLKPISGLCRRFNLN
jgi:asparagine synthase (glutamine-hydrolysing)